MSPAAKNFVSPSRPNAIDLDRAAFVLELAGSQPSDACWPTAMITLSTGERSASAPLVDRDRRRVDRAGEARRMQLQRLAPCRCRAPPSSRSRASARRLPRSCRADLRARPASRPGSASTVIIVTSERALAEAPRARSRSRCCRRRSPRRARPSFTFEVPMPMSRRNGRP